MTELTPQHPGVLTLDLNPEYPVFVDIEMFLGGIGRVVYEDKTEQFVDEYGSEYSPRLPEAELAEFCLANIDKYESFYTSNLTAILRFDTPKMAPFW
jgi:hypothetical protein